MSVVFDRGIQFALANIGRNHSEMAVTLRRVSSGQRVGRASDDPAGRAVAVNLRTQDLSTRRAIKNLNDGLSISQTAESAVSVSVDVLQRMRELAVQSASDTLASGDRSVLDLEYSSLLGELDRVAQDSTFNGLPLSDGTIAAIVVQVGAGRSSDNRISILLPNITANALGVDTTDVATVGTARSAMGSIDGALDAANSTRAGLGAAHNRLVTALRYAERYVSALSQSRSSIEDADLAYESAQLSMQRLRQAGGLSALANGLRALDSSRSLLASGGSGGEGAGGVGTVSPPQVPTYEKGDFPEDLIPP